MLVVLGFVIDKLINDKDFQDSIVLAINVANFTNKDEDWYRVGMFTGELIKQISGFNIPGTQSIYGESVFRDLLAL